MTEPSFGFYVLDARTALTWREVDYPTSATRWTFAYASPFGRGMQCAGGRGIRPRRRSGVHRDWLAAPGVVAVAGRRDPGRAMVVDARRSAVAS